MTLSQLLEPLESVIFLCIVFPGKVLKQLLTQTIEKAGRKRVYNKLNFLARIKSITRN